MNLSGFSRINQSSINKKPIIKFLNCPPTIIKISGLKVINQNLITKEIITKLSDYPPVITNKQFILRLVFSYKRRIQFNLSSNVYQTVFINIKIIVYKYIQQIIKFFLNKLELFILILVYNKKELFKKFIKTNTIYVNRASYSNKRINIYNNTENKKQ